MIDDEEVLKANARFYKAMNDASVDEMDNIWIDDASAICIHPGRDAIKGYEQIRASWDAIFSSTGSMLIITSDEQVTCRADMAWVSCTETISLMIDNELVAASAQATNIFRYIDGRWRMVVHHASPVPLKVAEEWPDTVN